MKYKLLIALIGLMISTGYTQTVINDVFGNRWVGYDITAGGNERRALGLGGTAAFGGFAGFLGNHPQARLHVSEYDQGNYATFPLVLGSLFRTDGLFGNNNTWSMWTGGTPGTSIERFNFTVPNNTSNLQINTIQPNSNIFLNANGNNILQATSTPLTGNNGTGQLLIQSDAVLPQNFPLMDIGGTIRFSEALATVGIAENTLFYGYTNAQGNPNGWGQDGFRAKFMNNAQAPFEDCLIFEKTDANGIDPDGCIRFTNTGNDGVEELALTIEGNNFVGVGSTYTGVGLTNLLPWRRLSVNDPNGPQLRLTNVVGATLNTGQFTDFNTTAGGNLEIDPRNNGVAAANIGNVRINYGLGAPAPFPNLSLDVNGQQNLRTVNQDDALNQVLVWEPTTGNIRWRDASTITPGGGGGSVTAQNGLTNLTPTIIEWGGTLLHSTNIEMSNFQIDFRNTGILRYIFNPDGTTIQNANSTSYASHTMNSSNTAGLLVNKFITGTTSRAIQTDMGSTSSFVNEQLDIASSITNYGFRTIVQQIGVASNQGLNAVAQNGVDNFGIQAAAQNGTNNYGVFTSASGGSGANWALYVNGDAFITGGDNFASDQTIKTNINSLGNTMSIINQLNPVTFNYNPSAAPGMILNSDLHYGLVAQDVVTVLPTLVDTVAVPAVRDSLGNIIYASQDILTVKYQEFTAILIKGMQEQQARIDAQDSIIDALYTMITSCCSSGGSGAMQAPSNNGINNTIPNNKEIDVRLTNNDYIILNQNSPNPFKDNTVITYHIPETVNFAQIIFYNNLGQIIKVVDVNERGEGRLNVFGEDLSTGLYSYTLLIDGKPFETKKMIKE